MLFIAGQIGWGPDERVVDGFVAQFTLALQNVRAVLDAAGVPVENVGRVTVYVTDKRVYLANGAAVGAAWRQVLGKHFPAMSLVQVADLLEEGAMVEIEATAVIPSGAAR